MQDFARSVTGIAIAFAAYSSAALLAKVRTIQFQATLIKTGWGALLVGAGLAIGKMMELAGVFSTTEGTIAGLNDEMKELGERTFLLLDPSEQKEKILETKNELLSMFEEGSMGASAFQSFLKNVATKINSLGLTASEAERIYTAALKAGVIERIGAKSEENAEYDAFVQKQRESIDQSEKEIEFIEKLKEQYPELAEAMGLVVKKTDDANDGWETFKKNLDVAAAASILTASSITSTSDALGAAEEAAKRAATAFISAEIQKAVSKWIASMLESSGPLAWLTAPLALAGGAAFGSLMGSAIERISFAQGGDFVTSGPQSILVGDNPGGRERVSVEPLSSPNINGPKGGITLNISAPLVDETVIDHIIPAIEKAQRNNLA
jgi:DNA-binding Lrp family transcriptional regulator